MVAEQNIAKNNRLHWLEMGIDGHMARGPRAGPKHEFLARHEHEPSTIISGLGRHEHDIGLCWATISAHSAGPARHENTQHDAAHVLARGPGAHSAHPAQRIKSATQPATPPLPIPTLAASHSIRIAGTRSPQYARTLGQGAPPRLRRQGQHPRRRPPPPPATTSSSSAAPSFSSTLLLSQSTWSTVASGGPLSAAVGELHGAADRRWARRSERRDVQLFFLFLRPPVWRPPTRCSSVAGGLFLPSAAGRRAAGRHGRNGPSCRSSCLGPARHENWAPCSCCARSVAHSAGTARHEVASCPPCSCCLVPVPPRARAVLGWAGQMATYSCANGEWVGGIRRTGVTLRETKLKLKAPWINWYLSHQTRLSSHIFSCSKRAFKAFNYLTHDQNF
jgi:hypothetical protein